MFCAALRLASFDGTTILRLAAFVKRFCKLILELILLSDTRTNQNWSKISLRLPDNIFRDFRVALTLRDATAQDVLYQAVIQYIKDTKLPDDMLLK